MSAIDRVIERSRQPGSFTERNRFTVARSSAIRKMRQFALADPYYYVLELIQSAIANGAEYIDIAAERDFFALSYFGGGYDEDSLSQLFDFLFASKSDVAFADLRQLALGINALMLMNPKEIVVESGDGTLEGTTRISIQGREDVVDVGKPDAPLRGTFVRASGLDRSAIESPFAWSASHPREQGVIENRCLTAPVPIFLNDVSLFGYSTQRTPNLLGYDRAVSFDEGDLYGTLGIKEIFSEGMNFDVIKLLTFGTWIQSVQREGALWQGESIQIGGVVGFDRLNKTADHAAIVRDGRFEEMWARLEPYVRELRTGQRVSGYDVRTLEGESLDIKGLREVMRSRLRAVLVPAVLSGVEAERARQIGESLDAPVLRVSEQDMGAVRAIGGPDVQVFQPYVATAEDHAFYSRPPFPEPARPWLIGEITVEPMSVAQLAREICDAHVGHIPQDAPPDVRKSAMGKIMSARREIAEALGGTIIELERDEGGAVLTDRLRLIAPDAVEHRDRWTIAHDVAVDGVVRAAIYTPKEVVTGPGELMVCLISSGRLLWSGRVPTLFPGHVLHVTLDDILPRDVARHVGGRPVRELMAEVLSHRIMRDFERATTRALESMPMDEVTPGTGPARMILARIARDGILRLRTHEGAERPSLVLSMFGDTPTDLSQLPVLETLDGAWRSIADVLQMMSAHHGVVYGVIPGVEPDLTGLDQTQILNLTEDDERLLISILGEPSYVRIDARDLLAVHVEDTPHAIMVRDVAVGLGARTLEHDALLLEPPIDAAGDAVQAAWWETEAGRAAEQSLLEQLMELQVSGYMKRDDPEHLEHARQALRHLQHFVLRRAGRAGPSFDVEDMALFVDVAGRACKLGHIERHVARHGGVVMADGRPINLMTLYQGEHVPMVPDDEEIEALAMDPFVMALLAERYGSVRGALDFALTEREAATRSSEEDTSAFLVSLEFDEPWGAGVVGIPVVRPERSATALLDRSNRVAHLMTEGPVRRFGLVGKVRARTEDVEAIESALHHIGQGLMTKLLDAFATLATSGPEWEGAVSAMLEYAGQHVHLVAMPHGGVRVVVHQPLALQILELPLFDTIGHMPVSAWRLLREFCVHVELDDDHGASHRFDTQLAGTLHPVLSEWLGRTAHPEVIARPPSTSHDSPEQRTRHDRTQMAVAEEELGFERALAQWLGRLRPEGDARVEVVRVVRRERTSHGIDPLDDWWAAWLGKEDEETASPFVFAHIRGEYKLLANGANPIVQRAIHGGGEDLAWALLSAYACINEALVPVTNEHEMIFQLNLAKALQDGALAPRAAASS